MRATCVTPNMLVAMTFRIHYTNQAVYNTDSSCSTNGDAVTSNRAHYNDTHTRTYAHCMLFIEWWLLPFSWCCKVQWKVSLCLRMSSPKKSCIHSWRVVQLSLALIRTAEEVTDQRPARTWQRLVHRNNPSPDWELGKNKHHHVTSLRSVLPTEQFIG